MVKKIRRPDEGERATDESQGGSEEASDIASGTEDEKGEQRFDPDGQVSEKKAASSCPSGA
jgi:ferredoxin